MECIRRDLYGTENDVEAGSSQPCPTPKPPVRRTSPEWIRALEAARLLLSDRAGPLPTAEVYDHVVRLCIALDGEEPRNNLSAMLANSGLLQANGLPDRR